MFFIIRMFLLGAVGTWQAAVLFVSALGAYENPFQGFFMALLMGSVALALVVVAIRVIAKEQRRWETRARRQGSMAVDLAARQ